MADESEIEAKVAKYYESKLEEHGPTSRGVDWKDEESQRLRFRVLTDLCPGILESDVLDWGCGYGSYLGYLQEMGFSGRFVGYDVSAKMIAEARRLHPEDEAKWQDTPPKDRLYTYVVASGIFNVKLKNDVESWERYVKYCLDQIYARCERGMAVNFLTRYSDPEHMRETLYYADPGRWIDYCVQRFGRNVKLLHDYPLFEYSMYVGRQR